MKTRISFEAPANRSADQLCRHATGCSCERPAIGRALVIGVVIELAMGLAAIASGATMIGIVACASMGVCMWMYAAAEIVAFYRVGLPTPVPSRVGRAVATSRHKVEAG